MNRESIYEQLNEARHYLMRRECTPRVLSESGVDALLDQLIIIQDGEEQMALAKQFNELVGAKDGNIRTDTKG